MKLIKYSPMILSVLNTTNSVRAFKTWVRAGDTKGDLRGLTFLVFKMVVLILILEISTTFSVISSEAEWEEAGAKREEDETFLQKSKFLFMIPSFVSIGK